MKASVTFPVGYMFGLTFVCASILIGLATATRDRVAANRQVLFEKAVLVAAGLADDDTSATEVHARFVAAVRDSSSRLEVNANGALVAHALPFEGQGFWNTIKGVIAITPDAARVVGFAVYEQSETPGLGAEITKPWFRNRFRNRPIGDTARPLCIEPEATATGTNVVHAVTGATQTCLRLEDMLNRAVQAWQTKRNAQESMNDALAPQGENKSPPFAPSSPFCSNSSPGQGPAS